MPLEQAPQSRKILKVIEECLNLFQSYQIPNELSQQVVNQVVFLYQFEAPRPAPQQGGK